MKVKTRPPGLEYERTGAKEHHRVLPYVLNGIWYARGRLEAVKIELLDDIDESLAVEALVVNLATRGLEYKWPGAKEDTRDVH
jgi:hypothetical protein